MASWVVDDQPLGAREPSCNPHLFDFEFAYLSEASLRLLDIGVVQDYTIRHADGLRAFKCTLGIAWEYFLPSFIPRL